MKTETLELTKTELNYMLNLVYENIREGWYYGNKKQFEKMQSKLLDKLLDLDLPIVDRMDAPYWQPYEGQPKPKRTENDYPKDYPS